LLDRIDGFYGLVSRGAIGDSDVGAGTGEGESDSAADALRAPGDESGFTGEGTVGSHIEMPRAQDAAPSILPCSVGDVTRERPELQFLRLR
jgi:hypothetical protein